MLPKIITKFFPLILVIFHVVGLYLFFNKENGAELTWLNLTLCGLLVFLAESKFKPAFYIFIFIALGGFLIELIGTKTGLLFGEYYYQSTLGWRLFDVPLIIGLNWFAIVLASANIARIINIPNIIRAVFAGILCVFMDIVIEPFAIAFDFWQWSDNEIPIFNYVTWFVFATLFAYIYLKTSLKMNKTAAWLYVIWMVFFLVLNVFIII